MVPRPARIRSRHPGITTAFLTVALTVAGCGEEARAAANGLIEVAEATGNPAALSFALYAYGYAFGDADPAAALDAQRRGLVIAQESGNRNTETALREVWPASRPSTATRWPRSTMSHLRSGISTTRATRP